MIFYEKNVQVIDISCCEYNDRNQDNLKELLMP